LIGRRNSSENKNEVWMSNLNKPDQLALDWREGNLYYSSQAHSNITVCNIKSKLCTELLPIFHNAVTKLAVDPRAGRLFVAGYTRKRNHYPSASIYVLGMDGKTDPLAKVIEGKIGMVSGLAVDPVKKLVFWSDVTTRDIGVCNYLGSQCQVVTTSRQSKPAGLVVLGSKLFWVAENIGWLQAHQIILNSTEERTLALPTNAHSMTFSHPSLQPRGLYPSLCASMRCSYLCLLSSPTSASCICPVSGYQPTDNTCLPIADIGSEQTSISTNANDPSVKKLSNTSNLTDVIIAILVILFILMIVLCLVFVWCRKTKRGPEIGIRFTNLSFNVNPSGGASHNSGLQTTDKSSGDVGFSNPRYRSDSDLQTVAWADLGRHSTPRGRNGPGDNDSAFQEPSLASSYDEDEAQHLYVSSYKDKDKLLE